MAYDKKLVVQYCFYEMVSSYFKSYKVANSLVEEALFMHFREAGNDFQYACEDFAIYSIENELPSLIDNVDIGKLDAKIKLSKESNTVSIDAGQVKFDVLLGYDKNGPSATYLNVVVEKAKPKKTTKKTTTAKSSNNKKAV